MNPNNGSLCGWLMYLQDNLACGMSQNGGQSLDSGDHIDFLSSEMKDHCAPVLRTHSDTQVPWITLADEPALYRMLLDRLRTLACVTSIESW